MAGIMASTNNILAKVDQLRWVKLVPKASSALTDAYYGVLSSIIPRKILLSSIIPREIWWPCLFFETYDEHEAFFENDRGFAGERMKVKKLA